MPTMRLFCGQNSLKMDLACPFYFFGVSWLHIRTKGCKACGTGTQERYCLIEDACAFKSAECYLRVFLSVNLQYLRYERRRVVKYGVSVFVLYNACATE